MRIINYKKLLKKININESPNCPSHLVRVGGSEAIICDREGLQYIVATPFIRAVEYLYDLNIRTESCGSNTENEIGISCNYEMLDETNKKIVDAYLKHKGQTLIKPYSNKGNVRFRISIIVDFNTDTVASAEKKLMEEIEKIGLVKQDVLFGSLSKKQAIQNTIDVMSPQIWQWNGMEFEPSKKNTMSEQEALEILIKQGRIVVDDVVWYSKELYHKHLDYINGQKQKGSVTTIHEEKNYNRNQEENELGFKKP